MTYGLMLAPDGRKIAYDQNGEDIVLLRASGGQETGVWIDVGANHPVNESVTKNLYDLGWRGVKVEPFPFLHELLNQHRPRDVNLCAALSDQPGTMVFSQNLSNSDLSSFSPALVAGYRSRGDQVVEREVAVMTLAEVCEKYVSSPLIDFIKIDVEGHELQVIDGHDFERFPVRVLCIEATAISMSDVQERLAAAGLERVLFDGLNAWFVRREELDTLGRVIGWPASMVLDWFHPWFCVRHSVEEPARTRVRRFNMRHLRTIGRRAWTAVGQRGGRVGQ